MPRKDIMQESFTAGELDNLLDAREDFDDFYKGVDRALNVTAQPTGGLTRREGLEYVDTIPTSFTYYKNNERNDFQMIRFTAREDEKYLVIVTHDGSNCVLKIFRDDSLVSTKDGADASVELPYNADEIQDMDWTQKLDFLILCHEDYQPRKVVRDSTDTFTVDKLSFDNIPQKDFDDSSSPAEVDEVQEINFSGMSGGDNYDISLEGEISAELQWDNSNSNNASRLQAELRRLPNTSDDGINVTVKDDNNNIFKVEFTGNDGAFDWAKIIVSIFSPGGSASVSVATEGDSGDEDAWSSTRGWPKHATFYQQRLWFAGSKELPETIWGSNISDFFDFKRGDGDESDAIQATINSDEVSEIRWIFPGRNLVIGTEGVEYYIPEEPITPDNIAIQATTRRGSRQHITPVESDGAVYYIQDGGHAIREYLYSFSEDSYKSKNISLLASHLIKDPQDMSLRQSTDTESADLIFISNGDDGSMACLSLLRSEEVIAFTEHQTTGRFRNTRSLDFDNYVMVERDIPEKSPVSNKWDSKADVPSAREGMASVTYDGKVHVIGGKEGADYASVHSVYDFNDDEWSRKASLPKKLYDTSADVMEDVIYCGGGEDSNGDDDDSFYKFEPGVNTWNELEDLPVKTSDHKIVVENERLFLIAPTATHEYKPNSDTWESKTAMSNERHDFAVTAYDGSIYVFGGEDSGNNVTATTQIYDVANDSWSTGTNMTTARRSAVAETAIQSTGDEIWVIGGHNGTSAVNDNEAYDISGDSWSSQATMTTARTNSASAMNNLKMYVMGGTDSGDVANNERYGHIQPVHHLEKYKEKSLLDGSKRKESGLGSKTISGFGHLQGETVDVHADGFYKGEKTVNSSGEITLDEKARDYVEVGKDLVEPTVTLLPVAFQIRDTVSARKKRIVEAGLVLHETQGMAVNGNRVSFRQYGDQFLDAKIPVFSGDKFIEGLRNWSDNPQLEITQPDPQPMTLLGVIQKVSY